MQRKDYQVEIYLADCFQGNNLTLLIDVFKLNKKCFMNVLVVIVSKKRRENLIENKKYLIKH